LKTKEDFELPTRTKVAIPMKSYLVPNPEDKELVILSDKEVSAAVMASTVWLKRLSFSSGGYCG